MANEEYDGNTNYANNANAFQKAGKAVAAKKTADTGATGGNPTASPFPDVPAQPGAYDPVMTGSNPTMPPRPAMPVTPRPNPNLTASAGNTAAQESFISGLNTSGALDDGSGFNRKFGAGETNQQYSDRLDAWKNKGTAVPTAPTQPNIAPQTPVVPKAPTNPLSTVAQQVSGNPAATAPYTAPPPKPPVYLPTGQMAPSEAPAQSILAGNNDGIIAENIRNLRQQGYPESQAIAMAYEKAGKM